MEILWVERKERAAMDILGKTKLSQKSGQPDLEQLEGALFSQSKGKFEFCQEKCQETLGR